MKSEPKGKIIGEIIQPEELPRKCFISHAYRDKKALEELSKILPSKIEIVTFPREEPEPEKAVSNDILPKILKCSGLIYLTGGYSDKSFWVQLERDYALRSRKKVFAFTPENGQLQRDLSRPIPLNIAVEYHIRDLEKVQRLLTWMKNERHFKIVEDTIKTRTGGISGDTLIGLGDLLLDDRIVLWLMSMWSVISAENFFSNEFVEHVIEQWDGENDDYIREFFFMDDDEEIDDQYEQLLWIVKRKSVFARISKTLSSKWSIESFQLQHEWIFETGMSYNDYTMINLYHKMKDDNFNWNRIDDLIIRLYQTLINVNS